MGMYCPECGKRSPVVANITADGLGARKASDVIAHRLGCGHVVGGEAYRNFLAEAEKIRNEANERIYQIKAGVSERTTALWKEMESSTQESAENAE